jgi:galactose-1-phosphate uridylyltransferase
MPDRLARGLWPHLPLTLSEVLTHLTKLIEENRWFPREWYPHHEGEPINESATIERQTPSRYVYRSVRAHPIQPYLLAESNERVFSSPQEAARHYLKWELHLPGDLDGWKVIG